MGVMIRRGQSQGFIATTEEVRKAAGQKAHGKQTALGSLLDKPRVIDLVGNLFANHGQGRRGQGSRTWFSTSSATVRGASGSL